MVPGRSHQQEAYDGSNPSSSYEGSNLSCNFEGRPGLQILSLQGRRERLGDLGASVKSLLASGLPSSLPFSFLVP